jgi:tetratricopeptide (TPR) repeat protein
MESVEHIANRAIDYAEKGQRDLAIEEFTRAIEINPNWGELFYNRGCTYSKMHKYDLAISDYNRALELNRNNVDALNNRGVAKQNSGNVSGGDYDVERARQLRGSKLRSAKSIPEKGSERYEFMVHHPFLYSWQEAGFLSAIFGQVSFWMLWGIGLLFIWVVFKLLSRWWS